MRGALGMIIHRRDAETLRKSKSQHQNHESAEVAEGAEAYKAPGFFAASHREACDKGASKRPSFGYFAGCESGLPSHDR